MNTIHCKFEYECPKRWEELDNTEEAGVKYCGHCKKKVYLAKDQAEFDSYALEKKVRGFGNDRG